jgi:hypothetical protein
MWVLGSLCYAASKGPVDVDAKSLKTLRRRCPDKYNLASGCGVPAIRNKPANHDGHASHAPQRYVQRAYCVEWMFSSPARTPPQGVAERALPGPASIQWQLAVRRGGRDGVGLTMVTSRPWAAMQSTHPHPRTPSRIPTMYLPSRYQGRRNRSGTRCRAPCWPWPSVNRRRGLVALCASTLPTSVVGNAMPLRGCETACITDAVTAEPDTGRDTCA